MPFDSDGEVMRLVSDTCGPLRRLLSSLFVSYADLAIGALNEGKVRYTKAGRHFRGQGQAAFSTGHMHIVATR
jgi:hypothetical protein